MNKEILELRKKYTKLQKEYEEFSAGWKRTGRGPTKDEQDKAISMLNEIDICGMELRMLEEEARIEEGAGQRASSVPPTYDGGYLGEDWGGGIGPAFRGPVRGGRDYRSLFGTEGLSNDGWRSPNEFFNTAIQGVPHENLRALKEGIGSEGGYLVPTEYAADIHDVALEGEIILPRATIEIMQSNEKDVPATAIGDHSSNLFGNFIAYWEAELGTLTEKTPKFRNVSLKAHKITGLMKYSSEWAEDTPNGESKITNLAGKGLGWYRDKAFLKGTGAGQPLGLLECPCTKEVSKETGQEASTICYENIVDMFAALHPACIQRAVWICHITTIPQLLTLHLDLGTGGTHIPILQGTGPSGGEATILTRPVIWTEKTEPLGTKGDIIFADLSQYVVGLRRELRFDRSIGPYFTEDAVAGRIISRVDGMGLWDETLTLEDGSSTVAPFAVLEAR
jgi:HK97 family phage major capsid protein